MTERILTAIYDTRGAAETARNDLVALGITSSDITIRGTDATSGATVEDRSFWDELKDLFLPDEDRSVYAEGMRRGGYLLTVHVSDEMEAQAREALERANPIDLDMQAESWRQSGWTGYEAGSTVSGSTAAAAGGTMAGYGSAERSSTTRGEGLRAGTSEGEEAVPVVEEELRVGKREASGGRVRVRSHVVERPVEEQVQLRDERVTVERRPVDRDLAPGEAAFQEKTIEAVERGEEAVVSKTPRVTEEIAVRKDTDERTETVRDTVRKTEVEVEDERVGQGSSEPRDREAR
jgi:uncharacterized protein (TIGR02271 family)